MTVIEFLLARIAEDEADALEDRGDTGMCDALSGVHYSAARVLAECQAKRQIVQLAVDGFTYNPNQTMRYLAAIYADHPEYREEWRP